MESHHQIFALYSRNYKRGSSRLHFEIKGWNFGNLKNKFRKRSTQNEVLYRPTEHRQNISSWWLSLLKVETIQTTLNKSICRPQIIKTFFSPFQILEKIGPVAYKLDLPPSSMIHPVFHISLSKQHHCDLPWQHHYVLLSKITIPYLSWKQVSTREQFKMALIPQSRY